MFFLDFLQLYNFAVHVCIVEAAIYYGFQEACPLPMGLQSSQIILPRSFIVCKTDRIASDDSVKLYVVSLNVFYLSFQLRGEIEGTNDAIQEKNSKYVILTLKS